MADEQDKVSTTALARQLDIPAQQLFAHRHLKQLARRPDFVATETEVDRVALA